MAAQEEKVSLEALKKSVLNEEDPIAKRTRSVFHLRQIGTNEAVDALAAGLNSPSVLLSHEIAFVLGQMKNPHAVPYLTAVLEDKEKKYHPIVRHEAAEALAAIGLPESLEILEKYSKDPATEVADTCKIAKEHLKWKLAHKGDDPVSIYDTHDPAPALDTKSRTLEDLRRVFLDPNASLFERYRAMFALRNKGDEAAIKVLGEGFSDKSPVFRHEIAYVMGQLQHPASIPLLKKVLIDKNEHAMVRHEAAEALGAIADESCLPLLKEYQKDSNQIVKQSCDVALDIMDYWTVPTTDQTSS